VRVLRFSPSPNSSYTLMSRSSPVAKSNIAAASSFASRIAPLGSVTRIASAAWSCSRRYSRSLRSTRSTSSALRSAIAADLASMLVASTSSSVNASGRALRTPRMPRVAPS
jgi:hypothetical protein